MAENLFRINPQLPQINARIQARVNRAVDRIWLALQRWAQEWSRKSARVSPVHTGMFRQSYFVIPVRRGMRLTVILANHMEYGKWLEFGAKNIAGGKVLGWKRGDPPIMEWRAKMEDVYNFRLSKNFKHSTGVYGPYTERAAGTVGSKKHDRAIDVTIKAFTLGSGEQMPMVRPTGYDLIPKIIAEVEKIIREELGRAA